VTTRRTRRVTATVAAAALLTLPVAGVATAQTPDEVGHYSGSADASVLELTAGDATEELADGLTLLDASVAPSATAADTRGGLEHDGESDLSSFGTGTNAGLTLADELAAEGLLVEATQTAPPDNEESTFEELVEVDGDPLLISQLATAEALARDCSEIACPDDDLVSFGTSLVNDTRLFPEGADGEDVAHLADVVDTRSEVSLTDVEGQDAKGVQAQATANVTRIDLFGGQDADALTIELLSEPTLTAVAGGTPGTAEVTYDAPVVQINGEGFEADPDEEQRLTIPPDAEVGEEDLLVDIEFGAFSQETSEDGTHASGEASVLEVTVLSTVDQGTAATFSLAPMSVEANAPEGGVACPDEPAAPLPVSKDGPDEVEPGEEFDYTIEVTNDRECTLSDVVVIDEVTGPDGTQITATDPEGTVDGTTVTWDDLDDLEPGASHDLTLTVAVPDDAQPGEAYRNEVTVTADCDGEPLEGADAIDRPAVDAGPVLDDDVTPEPEDGPDADPAAADQPLPETGGGLALAGLLAIGSALLLRRRSA
jgi:hypothetical protein